MRSLTWVQQWLQRVYEIEVEYDVMDFLITDRTVSYTHLTLPTILRV